MTPRKNNATDFKIIGIRPLKGCIEEIIKVLQEDQVYLYNDYEIDNEDNISQERSYPDYLYDFRKIKSVHAREFHPFFLTEPTSTTDNLITGGRATLIKFEKLFYACAATPIWQRCTFDSKGLAVFTLAKYALRQAATSNISSSDVFIYFSCKEINQNRY